MTKTYDIKGDHAFADITTWKPFTGDWNTFCRKAVTAANLHVVVEKSHTYPDGAKAFICVLSESSFIGVLSPDGKHTRVDCYTCGNEGNPMAAINAVREALERHTSNRKRLDRGVLPSRENIKTNYTARALGARLAMADMELRSKVDDYALFGKLDHAVHEYVLQCRGSFDDIITLSHKFEPDGMTAIILFRDGNGDFGSVDMHTYPEHRYVSQSAVVPGIDADLFLVCARQGLDVIRATLSNIGREPLMLTNVFTRAYKATPGKYVCLGKQSFSL